ncbi:NADH-quinone oxidoreductase subunit NuoE [Azospirillum sp.]|uniref:NADH-quinone oxidoreductase subunit NuoE n=1 Tax=Azospirillum sp. TaxID=34012 RepID=UPI002D6ADEC8|nr:NADH-quinone oxidoreductase subunit NuoE [Azospirillum sp.]HYD65350.1 NADH-quinone oxidoreductase subunit NuoE [Azospirillum sp.]
MSAHASVPANEPATFAFNPENMERAKRIIAKYPEGRQASACMPLLDLAQRQNDNWLPRVAMDYVADLLGMPRIRVYEVATFYTMYNKTPVGKHMIQVCTTTPCWLRGSDDIVATCEHKLGIHVGEVSDDGQFSLHEVECSGACVNAPVVQIGDDYYEDVSPEHMEKIIDALKRGETPKAGSQIGRRSSEPVGGPTTLKAFCGEAATQGDD